MTSLLLNPASRLLKSRRCIAALEFALLSPVFVLAFVGVVDLGGALYTWSRLEGALAAGGNYAFSKYGSVTDTALATTIGTIVAESTFVNPSNGSGTPANVTVNVNNGVTYAVTSGTGTPGGSSSSSCYCPTGSPSSWTWGSAVTCGSSCTGGGFAGKFITITASQTFSPFISSYSFSMSGSNYRYTQSTTMSDGLIIQTQ